MTTTPEHLTFATQGGEFSYHALAARTIAQDPNVVIEEHEKFGDVVHASRNHQPGLGVIAITSAAGTVEASAKEIVRKRPSALPPIVGRVDIPVELSLIGSVRQDLRELDRWGVRCLAQKPAWLQTEEFRRKNLPKMKRDYRSESTAAIREMIDRNDPDYIAMGPNFAAEPLGGVVLVKRINPADSLTSFWVLQRDPRQQILPEDPTKTEPRTVLSIAHPEGDGEINKCWELADYMGIKVARFIPFDIGDYAKHNPMLRRGGGLLEIEHDLYDEETTEFCARVHGIEANDGVPGPFGAIKLGTYKWHPEPTIGIETLVDLTSPQSS